MEKKTNFTQKEIKPINGMGMLILITLGILAAIAMIVVGCINLGWNCNDYRRRTGNNYSSAFICGS